MEVVGKLSSETKLQVHNHKVQKIHMIPKLTILFSAEIPKSFKEV